LPENHNLELLPLRFSMTTTVGDVGSGREGFLAMFWGKWVSFWMV